MTKRFSINIALSACSLLLVASPVFAATAEPATKCVTAATQATHAGAIALMEKDIAGYSKSASAAAAIDTYRQTMIIAWDAMKEPYCGFGAYGIKSAVKSYGKNIARARATFLAQAKGKPVAAAIQVTVPVVKTPIEPTLRDLHRGMETDAVLNLQKTLNRYLGSKADESILTGFFGAKTEKILIQFQIDKGLIDDADSAGAGTVGPKTAVALSKI